MIDNKVEEIKKHVDSIMKILGIEPTESNELTPLRIAKMYCNEVFQNRNNSNLEELNSRMKLFPNEGESYAITMDNIEFHSMCEHHWLPFMGEVSITYIPGKKIIGLSKLPRVVKYFSKKPQLQERLTHEIGNYLAKLLEPSYLRVDITAVHTCVMCRGIESNSKTTTYFEFTREDKNVC